MQTAKLIRQNFSWLLVISFILLYIATFIVASFNKYSCFFYGDWDLAIYNQVFRGLSLGRPFMSLVEVPFLGIHAELTMLLLLPIYSIFSHPLTLLVVQTCFLALAAIPLFLIARTILNEFWAVILVLLYLFYPALAYINLNEFHPESLLPFIQFFLFFFFLKNDFKKFVIFMFLLLFAKENMSLILIMFGFYALIKRREKKWAILPILAGSLWFFVYLKILMPSLNKGKVEFYSLYAHLGNGLTEITRSILLHPVKIIRILLRPDRLEYMFKLFSSLSFLPLFSPLILLIVLPNFLQHLLSARLTEVDIRYYYPAESLAFIFIAAVFGLRSFLSFKFVRVFKNFYSCGVIIISILIIIQLYPFDIVLNRLNPDKIDRRSAAVKESFVKMIPDNAVVISTFEFLPKLSRVTDRLYSFHRIIMGAYHEGMRFEPPKDLELALLNFEDVPTYYVFLSDRAKAKSNISNFFHANSWCPVRAAGDILLFKKNSESCLDLFNISRFRGMKKDSSGLIFDTFRLDSYSVEKFNLRKGENVKLTLRWHLVKKTKKDYTLRIKLLDTRGREVFVDNHPLCYDIYPVRLWDSQDAIEENFWLPIPKDIDSGTYRISVKPFERLTEFKVSSIYNDSTLAYINVR